MSFDYQRLKGKIVEKYNKQSDFARAMQMSERTLSLKMNGRVAWKQTEIMKAIKLLDLKDSDIQPYFFVIKVQDIEQKLSRKGG